MSDLKNRERYTTSVDKEIIKKFRELSEKTKIPMSKLIDEAITDLLKKKSK